MTKAQAQKEIEALRAQIHRHNYNYYVLASPTIPDYEFDMLLERLIELEKSYPEFVTPDSPSLRVGGEITKEFPTVTHKRRMMSLSNTYSSEELREFYKRVQKALSNEGISAFEMVAELKYDGVAISLTYRDGVFVQGATRGDGVTGDDITSNLKTIQTIPLRVQESPATRALLDGEFEVRGEVYMQKKDFEKLNAQRAASEEPLFANPRNAAAGTLKQQDSREVAKRKLTMVAYQLESDALDDKFTHSQRLKLLEELGFNVGKVNRVCTSLDEVEEFLREWESRRDDLPFEIDGAVIKVNDIRQRNVLGETMKSPRWAIAYKFSARQAETVLNGVTCQVGRIGTVTPVAELQPVKLAGSTISRATLHNFDEIKRLDVRLGDTIVLEKSGDVIPKIVRVVDSRRPPSATPIAPPTHCPECGTALVKPDNEVNLYCPNEDGCPAQRKGRILHYASRNAMDIENCGDAIVEQLLKENLIADAGDLYSLEKSRLAELERFGEKSAQNLLDAIERSKRRSFDRLIFALGIRHVGLATARALAQKFPSITDLQAAPLEALQETDDVGDTIAESIFTYFQKPSTKMLIEKLTRAGVKMSSEQVERVKNARVENKTFVFTGTLESLKRDEASSMVLARGGKVSGSVSKKTDFVVAGSEAGSKLEKAVQLGVKVLTEAEFRELMQ